MTVRVLTDIERRWPKIFSGICLSFFLLAFALAEDENTGRARNSTVDGEADNVTSPGDAGLLDVLLH